MKIISYNLNGIRAAIKKDLADFIKRHDPDVLCIQETKAHLVDIDTALFESLGYHCHWHSAVKKGYSGVGIMSKMKPDAVHIGCGAEHFDNEGRVISADFGDITIVNTYFPSGTSGEERQGVKMSFLDNYLKFINDLKNTRPNLIVCGDYNICHKKEDIHDPVGNKKNSGFLPEEREWMDVWFGNGMIDTYRHFNPDALHQYSWWSNRFNARGNNKGWRIDYISASETLKDKLKSAAIYQQEVHSDHCPIELVLGED
jgi:exodeoxyribonuclease III